MAEHEFTLLGDALWLDFVNNVLPDAAAYARWAEVQGLDPASDPLCFAEVRQLHDRFTSLAEALHAGVRPSATTINLLNEHLARRSGHERLTRVSGEWRLQFVRSEPASALDAIVRSAATTLADSSATVRRCAGGDCALFFIDHSGTGGRTWCSAMRCGRSAYVERRRGRGLAR